jgi:predicted transporter
MRTVVTTILLLSIPRLALACPVCFGSADSAQTKAAQAGILALLAVTVAMLASIAGFFFIYLRRRIRLFEESNGGGF